MAKEKQLNITHSPILVHPERPVVVWAADKFLFALNFQDDLFECHRLSDQTESIRSIDYCPAMLDGELLSDCWVVSSNDKTISVLTDKTFKVKERFLLRKKPSAVKVISGGASLIIGDKFGDLFMYTVDDLRALTKQAIANNETHMKSNEKDKLWQQSNGEIMSRFHDVQIEKDVDSRNLEPIEVDNEKSNLRPFAGHLAEITSLAFCCHSQLIVTGDRDEKLRVGRLDVPHVTVGYGLGHTEFITSICPLKDHPGFLVSSAGDNSLRLWFVRDGIEDVLSHTEEGCIQVDVISLPSIPSSVVYSTLGSLLVICEGLEGVAHIKLVKDKDRLSFSTEPYQVIKLSAIPQAIAPLMIDPKNHFRSFAFLNDCIRSQSFHTFLWVDREGGLRAPVDIIEGQSLFEQPWKGLDIGSPISCGAICLWKRNRLPEAPTLEERVERRKRGCRRNEPPTI